MAAQKPTFECRGDVWQLWHWLDHPEEAPAEVLFEGVPGSAKTRNILEWIKAALLRYPGSRCVFVREVLRDLRDSVLPIWEEEVLGLDHPSLRWGGTREHRMGYHAPEGWSVSLRDYADPNRLYSTAWEIVYFNEVQQTELMKWVRFARGQRARGEVRGVKQQLPRLPFRIRIGDCNPEGPTHWANERACPGPDCPLSRGTGRCQHRMHRLIGRFWDNPLYYDAEREDWTAAGRDYLLQLQESTEGTVLYDRLVRGMWIAAEGLVWGNYDHREQLVSFEMRQSGDGSWVLEGEGLPGRSVAVEMFVGGHDIGFTKPGCAQLWAFDYLGRGYRVLEHYARGLPTDSPVRRVRRGEIGAVQSWCDVWEDWWETYRPVKVVTDHDPDFIRQLRTRLRLRETDASVGEWQKHNRGPTGEKTGIDIVRRQMERRPDGSRGLYLRREAHVFGRERALKLIGKPTGTDEELGLYCYPSADELKNTKEPTPDPRCEDHGCDTMRGVFTWVEYKDKTGWKPRKAPSYAPGSIGALLRAHNAEPPWEKS